MGGHTSVIDIVIEPTKLILDQPNDLTIWLTNTESKTITNILCTLNLPANKVSLLKGSKRIEASRIEAGQKIRHTIQVIPKSSGTLAITSPNFSYRDGFGKSQRIKDLRLQITVMEKIAMPPQPLPKIKLEIITTELALNQWGKLEGIVSNVGLITLQNITLKVVGRVEYDKAVSLGSLSASTNARFSLLVRALESGTHVPISIETIYTDEVERTYSCSFSQSLLVNPQKTSEPSSIHFSGPTTFGGGFAVGNYKGNVTHNHGQSPNLAEAAAEIQQLLEQLSQTYPTATTAENLTIVTQAAKQIENNPTLKAKIINALKAGGTEGLKEAIDHPLVNILMATIEGWLDAE